MKNPDTQKGNESPRSGGKTPGLAPLANKFWIESTKKVTQFIEQVNVM